MVRQRKTKEPKKAKAIKLEQPDRSGPTDKTLLDFAQDKDLFAQADRRMKELAGEDPSSDEDEDEDAAVLSPTAERFMETVLWTISLAILHMTFDVLVHRQYGREMNYPDIALRTVRAWVVFFILFWPLHPHESSPILVPGIAEKYQKHIRQGIFSILSAVAGCYLIHISNNYSYLAVMKQAPPVGCLWLWAVIELELVPAVLSLGIAGGFLWWRGYSVM